MMTEIGQLLSDYVRTGSEQAFREILERYVDLVHSTAVRLMNGDAHRAQDVTQTVFIDLARLARTLPAGVMLGGWLHRHTCYVAAGVVRAERRRLVRERKAVEMNALNEESPETRLAQVAPILDEAINQLGQEDRSAILLRFFERRDFRSLGEALGGSEEAARKRVHRALEKLRQGLKARGVSLSSTALAAMLTAGAVQTAPAALAVGIAAAVLAGGASAPVTSATLLKLMTMNKLTVSLTGLVLLVGVGALKREHDTATRLRDDNSALRQQLDELGSNLQSMSNRLATAADAQAGARGQVDELARLRGEVSNLRRQSADAAKAKGRGRTAAAPHAQPSGDNAEEQPEAAPIVRMTQAKNWMLLFFQYSSDHDGKMPESFDQLSNHIEKAFAGAQRESFGDRAEFEQSGSRFELLSREPLDQILNSPAAIVLREKEAWQGSNGGWFRTYGFGDGHTEVHRSEDGNFAPWEAQHLPKTKAQ